jgi:hypothetical protein
MEKKNKDKNSHVRADGTNIRADALMHPRGRILFFIFYFFLASARTGPAFAWTGIYLFIYLFSTSPQMHSRVCADVTNIIAGRPRVHADTLGFARTKFSACGSLKNPSAG